ncbi:cyclase family protein [Clostridium sp. ZS2-4]|uniref:cyclase family protein n=1 Tax=Clostridium sp. ZS2-4 TaxID=2987703 RepID=UPI00227AC982|nr:cyclase family protein [Clostridium sp. ZS2-4]MCY6355064.1 cyclase family protein [Clostridium sp. ZS2-4]
MFIDLTLKLSKDHPAFQWAATQKNHLMARGHLATHIDVYEKTQVPLEYMESRGIIFDVSGIEDRKILKDDIDINMIKPGDFVIFMTEIMKESPYGENKYVTEHPELSWDLIKELINKKIHFIGIDAAGIRRGKEHIEVDKMCERKGVFVIENMTNLNTLKANIKEEFKIYTLWIDYEDYTGLPCRIVAKI